MKKLSTRWVIDPDLLAWIRGEAGRRRCSMSQVVRDLVIDEMARRAKAGAS